MGYTSSKVKNRYNKKAYDNITVRLPKRMKEQLKDKCENDGISMNSIFLNAAKKYINKE